MAFRGTGRLQVQDLEGYLMARVRFAKGRRVAMEELVCGWNADSEEDIGAAP